MGKGHARGMHVGCQRCMAQYFSHADRHNRNILLRKLTQGEDFERSLDGTSQIIASCSTPVRN